MKKFETLTRKRDNDFYKVCCRLLAQSASAGRPHGSLRELVEDAISRPAPQFYISYDYALRKFRKKAYARSLAYSGKKKMWTDLERKVIFYAERFSISLSDAVIRVLAECPAPQFYISQSQGEKIFRQMRRRRRRRFYSAR